VAEELTSKLFAEGRVLREPVAGERGYWAGAPGIYYAADESAWYLTYRIRRPRGVAPDRGGEARISRSKDLQNWEDVWSVTKDRFDSASIERCALRRGADGQWRYFISFVDPADGRWCVSVITSRDIQKLDPGTAKPIFKAKALGLEGIKDPWIFDHEGTFYMVLSVALRTARTSEQSHATLDIFNTGECVSATGLAISRNLENWAWQGVVFAPEGTGWDRYCRRINSVLPYEGKFFGFYDGSASEAENYEERSGVAVSSDLRQWKSLTVAGPRFTSPNASRSLRYVDAQLHSGQGLFFYEFARPDGAHDLRLATIKAESLSLA